MNKLIFAKCKKAGIVFLILFLLSTSLTFSQLQVGVNLGQSFSTFYGDQPHVSNNGILSFVGSVNGTYALNEQIGVKLGIGYNQYGGSLVEYENDVRYGMDYFDLPFPLKTIDRTVRINTLEIPVLASYKIIDLGGASLHALGGVSFGFSLGAKVNSEITAPMMESDVNMVFVSYNEDVYDKRNYQGMNFGGILGIECQVPIDAGQISFTAGYRHGFTDVRKGYSYIQYSGVQSDLNTGSVQFTLGYSYNL